MTGVRIRNIVLMPDRRAVKRVAMASPVEMASGREMASPAGMASGCKMASGREMAPERGMASRREVAFRVAMPSPSRWAAPGSATRRRVPARSARPTSGPIHPREGVNRIAVS